MKGNKLLSNLLLIAALAFLVWYFAFPVSLAQKLPAQEGIRIVAREYDEAGNLVEAVCYLPDQTSANEAIRAVLAEYPCFRTFNLNGKQTYQGFRMERQYIIQTDSMQTYIHAFGSNNITIGDSVLRMGWFNNNQGLAFVEEIHAILQSGDSDIVIESHEIIETAPAA